MSVSKLTRTTSFCVANLEDLNGSAPSTKPQEPTPEPIRHPKLTRTKNFSVINPEDLNGLETPVITRGPTPEQMQSLIEKARKDWEMQEMIDRQKALYKTVYFPVSDAVNVQFSQKVCAK
jgi:hypothetical protein